MTIIDQILDTFHRNGNALYDGGEVVTQSQHALQAAHFAEQEGQSDTLIAAALLHDYGHVMDESEDSIDREADGRHELVGARFLEQHFEAAVTEPGKLHVAAKRYLCATEDSYFGELSPVSVKSLELQGGPFTPAQAKAFEKNPHYKDAVQVRRYDERAKDPALTTPNLEHFRRYLEAGLKAP
ncbi:MAG: HD domain-containing protein [Candidatus Latescibacteria bacterium]|nr:HD domain-containing protein [Candidatus Latescibacterota bacterium]